MKNTYLSIIKKIILLVFIFSSGVLIGYNFTKQNDESNKEQIVFSIGDKSWNTADTLVGLNSFDKTTLSNFIRNYAIFESLKDKYGSEFVEQKVEDLMIEKYKQNNLDPKNPTSIFKLGYSSKEEFKNHLTLMTLINRYIDDQISESEVKKAYKDWNPSMSVVIIPTDNIDDIDKLQEDWKEVEDKDSDKLYTFLHERDITSEAIDIPYNQKMFTKEDYESMKKLKKFESTAVTSPSGDSELLVFALTNTKKTDYETDKAAVKSDLKAELQSDEVKFTNQLIEDLDIKGSEGFDLTFK